MRTLAVLIVLSTGIAGVAASAHFNRGASATRTMSVGQMDTTAYPNTLNMVIGPNLEGGSQALIVDIPDEHNDGDLISSLYGRLSLTGVTTCAQAAHPDVPVYDTEDEDGDGDYGEVLRYDQYVCTEPDVDLTRPGAASMVLLACPNGFVTDNDPATDNDNNPVTEARYDGPGPHTCSTGDWVVVNNPQPASDSPWGVVAQARHSGAHTATLPYGGNSEMGPIGPVVTYQDGQTLEMVACYGVNQGQSTDLAGLTATFDIEWNAARRAGVTREQTRTYGTAPLDPEWTATGCDQALTRPQTGSFPGSPGPGDDNPGEF